MKIARLDTLPRQDNIFLGGEPNKRYGKRQLIVVSDDYDFSGNSATDVTDIENMTLLENDGSISYTNYRNSLTTILDNSIYSGLTTNEQSILCKHFIMGKSDRDIFYSDNEQKEYGYDLLIRLDEDEEEKIFIDRAEELLTTTTTTHKVFDDVEKGVNKKHITAINYKTELKSGISYTPVFTISQSGETAGFLEKTEYYKGFVDKENKGDLIVTVDEIYHLDYTEPSYEYTARPITGRTKTWCWVKSDGTPDTINTKVKEKKYDTRRKQHEEGIRRRDNVVEQLIDNVGLAGVLSGTFSGSTHAHENLSVLLETHSADFSSWKSSGLGSLLNHLDGDLITLWMDDTIADNGYTQAMCPWMIGLTYKTYIKEKLKGNIK